MVGKNGWGGLGGAFRSFSTRMFGDDLAEELAPMSASSNHDSSRSAVGATSTDGPMSWKSATMPHLRTTPLEQPPATQPPLETLSVDQLQQRMKELMKQPELWSLFKAELSQQEHPNHPETVRTVLIDFLNRHPEQQPTVAATGQSRRPSGAAKVFQAFNMSLEAESTHTPLSLSRSTGSTHKEAPPEWTPEELQQQMKRLMQQPALWAEFKEGLAQQENPTDPDTIRVILVDFLQKHGIEKEVHPKAQLPPSSATTPKRQKLPSIFQGFNTDLDGESQHVSQTRQTPSLRRQHTPQKPASNAVQVDMQHTLRLLRNDPELYEKYQQRLLEDEADSGDLLLRFLKDHQKDLKDLHLAKLAEEQRAREEASLLHLETATLAEEESQQSFHRRHYVQPPSNHSEGTDPAYMHRDRRQQMMAYRDTISSQSKRKVQSAMKSLAGECDSENALPPTPSAASRSSQSEHVRSQEQHKQRESLSSQSMHHVQSALKSLAGEVDEEPPASSAPATHAHKDVLAEKAASKGSAAPTSLPKLHPLPESAKTVWMNLESDQPHPEQKKQEMDSTFASLISWGKNFSLSGDNASTHTENSFRRGWRQMSTFVAKEMENMTCELDESEPSVNRSQTTEDLIEPSQLKLPGADGPLHSSMPISFDAGNEDEDPMFQEASAIAFRRREHTSTQLTHPTTLESIRDVDEEDLDASVSEHVAAALRDPMMEVTMHEEQPENLSSNGLAELAGPVEIGSLPKDDAQVEEDPPEHPLEPPTTMVEQQEPEDADIQEQETQLQEGATSTESLETNDLTESAAEIASDGEARSPLEPPTTMAEQQEAEEESEREEADIQEQETQLREGAKPTLPLETNDSTESAAEIASDGETRNPLEPPTTMAEQQEAEEESEIEEADIQEPETELQAGATPTESLETINDWEGNAAETASGSDGETRNELPQGEPDDDSLL